MIMCPFSTDMILMVAVTRATPVWEVLDYMEEAGAILDGDKAETTLMLGSKELASTKTLGTYGVKDLSIIMMSSQSCRPIEETFLVTKGTDTGACSRLSNHSQLQQMQALGATELELAASVRAGIAGFQCGCHWASMAGRRCKRWLPARGICAQCRTEEGERCGCNCESCRRGADF